MATPPSPDQAPIARARLAGRKLASMIARLPGVSRAPPIPCSSRAAIRTSALGATAQSSEAAVKTPASYQSTLVANLKTPIPNTKIRRRP